MKAFLIKRILYVCMTAAIAGCFSTDPGRTDTNGPIDKPETPAITIVSPAQVDTMYTVGFSLTWRYEIETATVSHVVLIKDAQIFRPLVSGANRHAVIDSSYLTGKSEVTLMVAGITQAGDTLWSDTHTVAVRAPRPGEDIIMIFPNGHEQVNVNDEWSIRWWANTDFTPSVVVLVSSDNGQSWESLLDTEIESTNELWGDLSMERGRIPAGSGNRIRIESYTDNQNSDDSDRSFSTCTGPCSGSN